MLEEQGKLGVLDEIYESCKAQENLPAEEVTNEVKRVYDQYKTAFINWASSKYNNVGVVVIEDVYSEVILDFYCFRDC